MAAARLLTERGARVGLLDRHPQALSEAAADLRAAAVGVADVPASHGRTRGCRAHRRGTRRAADVLVNAAGIYRVTALDRLEAEEWDDVLATNLRGTFLVSREVVARLPRREGAAIVNLASTAAFAGDADEPAAHYGASKAGVVALTKQMAVEWAPVRVNAVAPGVIETPMLRLMDDPVSGQAYLDERVPSGVWVGPTRSRIRSCSSRRTGLRTSPARRSSSMAARHRRDEGSRRASSC